MQAQQKSEPDSYTLQLINETPHWGVYLSSWSHGLMYQNDHGTIIGETTMPLIGGYYNLKNFRVQAGWGFGNNCDIDLRYYITNGLNVNLSSNIMEHDLEWEREYYSTSSSSYNYRSLGSHLYFENAIALGYSFLAFNQLVITPYAQASLSFSSDEEWPNYVQSSSSNMRIKVNNKTDQDLSWQYGGGLELELMPHFTSFPKASSSKSFFAKNFAFSLFLRLELMGRSSSEMKYNVSIDEWVDGHKVYYEESNDYNINSYDVTVGIRWLLGN